MYSKYIVMLFITSGYSKIQINVKPASNKVDTVIEWSGVNEKRITEKEINLFKITQYNLIEGVTVELGNWSIPKEVFLKDPTPYGNLYQKHRWMQVNRILRVKKAEVLQVVNENITLAVHRFINNTTKRIRKKVGLVEEIENTVYSSWHDGGLPDEDIFYDINILYGKESFRFENKWRKSNFKSFNFGFGVPHIGHVNINPGKSVNIVLTAVKTILLVKVDYSAMLSGNVIANYAKRYGKHYYWAPSVASIMKAAKLKNEIVTTEYLDIRCHFDPHLEIVNKVIP